MIHQLRRVVPRGTIRKATLRLDQNVLPSRISLEKSILVLDIRDIVKNILSSVKLSQKVYQGMAQVTDGPVTEPWQAR